MFKRIEVIQKRISNVKELSNTLFEKTLQWNLYKTYSRLWGLRILLIDTIIAENYR